MAAAIFITSAGAAQIAPKLLELAHVETVTLRRYFQRGEFLGYIVQVRTKNEQYTLIENMLNSLNTPN